MYFTLFQNGIDKKWLVDYHYRMSITKTDNITRNFFLGFIRLHILFHAEQEPVFGLDLIRELAHHRYELSPGTLYPILHAMEQDGLLVVEKTVVAGKQRKYYRTTPLGSQVLEAARERMRELIDEIQLYPNQSKEGHP